MAKNIEWVRRKILQTAKQLILAHGYRRTTIRQIVQASGIASGSIYHLFPNKDKIFWALVQELLESTTRIVAWDFASETPQFRYAAILEVELCSIAENPAVQEIYYESYAQPETFEQVVARAVAFQKEMVPIEDSAEDEEERRRKTLLFKGAMYGYIMSFAFEQEIDPVRARIALVAMALELIDMDAAESQELAERMEGMQKAWCEIAKTILQDAPAGEPDARTDPTGMQEGRPSM